MEWQRRIEQPPTADSAHSWRSLALELLDDGDPVRARLVLKALLGTCKDDVAAYILLIRSCLAMGHSAAHEAVESAQTVYTLCQQRADPALPKALLALGVATGCLARGPTLSQAERSHFRAEARNFLQQVLAVQPADSVALYNLGLLAAEGGHLEDATQHARKALAVGASPTSPITLYTLALLALLMTARQQLRMALAIVEKGLSSCRSAAEGSSPPGPSELLLIIIQAHLLVALGDSNGALKALGACQRRCTPETGLPSGASRQKRQLTEQQIQIWQALATIYLDQDQIEDASMCVERLQQLEPMSARTLHLVARLHEARGLIPQAMDQYKSALALDSTHATSMISLGALYCNRGRAHPASGASDLAVATGLLVEGLRYQPLASEGWFALGQVYECQGLRQEAEQHLFTAMQLATSRPVLSYEALPLSMMEEGDCP